MYRNDEAVYGRMGMLIAKSQGKGNFMLVSDYLAVHVTSERATMPMANLDAISQLLVRARAFWTLGLIHGCWRISLILDSRCSGTVCKGDYHVFFKSNNPGNAGREKRDGVF